MKVGEEEIVEMEGSELSTVATSCESQGVIIFAAEYPFR
jgi:hypothetical protein